MSLPGPQGGPGWEDAGPWCESCPHGVPESSIRRSRPSFMGISTRKGDPLPAHRLLAAERWDTHLTRLPHTCDVQGAFLLCNPLSIKASSLPALAWLTHRRPEGSVEMSLLWEAFCSPSRILMAWLWGPDISYICAFYLAHLMALCSLLASPKWTVVLDVLPRACTE